MKNKFLKLTLVSLFCLSITSCYTLSYAVGTGSQTGIEVTEKIII